MKILTESILYQDGVPEEIYKDFLSDINAQIDRMSELISDLLLMTKIESGDNGAKKEEADLDELVQDIMDTLGPIAEQKDILLSYANKTLYAQSVSLAAFPRRFETWWKMLSSTQRRGGAVQVRLYKDTHSAYIAVSDTGEGIAEEDLDRIFERFYRVDKARARQTGGSDWGFISCAALR